MVYRNCLKVLADLSSIEQKIAKIEKILIRSSIEVDSQKLLLEIIKNHVCIEDE